MACFLLYLFLSLAVLAGTGSATFADEFDIPSQELDLQASYRIAGNPNCPSGECPFDHLSGKNLTIWHGNGDCSYLFLYCHFEKIQLELLSPTGTTEALLWMKGNPAQDRPLVYPQPVAQCSRRNNAGVIPPDSPEFRAVANGLNFGTRTSIQFNHDQCGTKIDRPDLGRDVQYEKQSNQVELVEFLGIHGQNNPVINYISRTLVNIQCCLSTDTSDGSCSSGDPVPVLQFIQNCTEKSFCLSCVSDVAEERFRCEVSLNPGESLGGNGQLGYYVDSCHAHDAADHDKKVILFDSSGNNANLQVERETCASNSYQFDAPWIQFSDSASSFDPHQINIECSVKVDNKVNLASHQLSTTNDLCSKGSLCSSVTASAADRAGFFQPGQLTLLS